MPQLNAAVKQLNEEAQKLAPVAKQAIRVGAGGGPQFTDDK